MVAANICSRNRGKVMYHLEHHLEKMLDLVLETEMWKVGLLRHRSKANQDGHGMLQVSASIYNKNLPDNYQVV